MPIHRFSNFILVLVVGLAPAFLQAAEPKIVVISTGGTIAMKEDPYSGAPIPALSGDELMRAVPEIRSLAEIETIEFSNIPSDYMTPQKWLELAALVNKTLSRSEVTGVVITHGTDTLEETAFFLDLVLESNKPVVCIGAQRNASEADSDGPRNLRNAVRQILSPQSAGMGVTITMNEFIHSARAATKAHTSNVETFQSGDYGHLGAVDADRVVFFRRPLRRQHFSLPRELPRVEMVTMYAGADGKLLEHALEDGAKGIIVAALGMGNVNQPFYQSIEKALRGQIPVVVSTRVPRGRVQPHYGFVGGGATLQKIGAVFSDDLSPWKARILLMLALANSMESDRLQSLFDR